MTNRIATALTLVFAFLGLADAWYLADSALSGAALTCNIAGLDGCNVVAQSPYSHLFGVPLGVYGVFFYALVFVLAALAFVVSERALTLGLFALGVVGLLASIAFMAIQVFLIQALCMYCLASAVISLFLFITTALMHVRRKRIPEEPVVAPWGAGTAS